MLFDFLYSYISWQTFLIGIIAIVIALTLHEFAHAFSAKFFGDDTAQRAGRLTVNPIAHIDPIGLLLVATVGFGYAKPVPTNPDNFTTKIASPVIAAAGPLMNIVLAFVVYNIWQAFLGSSVDTLFGFYQSKFFYYFVLFNIMLFFFNLIPLGALDGHYIAEAVLPTPLNKHYKYWNDKIGNYLLLGLIVLSIFGYPIFQKLKPIAERLMVDMQL